jgi:radical SAM superfamily enzyme YgiQ (UPF0313 family)
MKLALINPMEVLIGDENFMLLFDDLSKKYVFRPKFSGFGLGLLVIAALTPPEYKIDVIDENFDPIPWKTRYDLIGITANTSQAMRAYEIADEFRKRGNTVVIGGIHATVLADEAKGHADSVVVGEAEGSWPVLLEDLKHNKLKPFYKNQGAVDLRQSPIPRYDLLKGKNYNIIWVQTTRGCPHDCEFCAASRVYGRKYRRKGVEQITREVEVIKRIWARPQVSFADDNMFVDRVHSAVLLDRFKELDIKYFAQSDISIAEDKEFLRLLRDSGCSILFIGFETLSREGLIEINSNKWKARYLENYERYIDRIQTMGIGVMGGFVIGLDTDTVSTFNEIAEFVIRNNLYAMQLTILTPLPGSRLRERLLAENRITNINDWSRYTCNDINIIPRNMTAEQLQAGFFSIHRRVYSDEACRRRMEYFKEIYSKIVENKSVKDIHFRSHNALVEMEAG